MMMKSRRKVRKVKKMRKMRKMKMKMKTQSLVGAPEGKLA